LYGVVKAVDAEKRTITLATTARTERRGERGEAAQEEEKTYTLAKRAEIAVDDGRARLLSLKEMKLADLPTGALASLRLAPDLQHVLTIVAQGGSVRGTVKAVDAAKNQITLTTRGPGRGDDAGEEKTIDVSADADVLLDEGKGGRFSVREGKLADVPVGAIAMVQLGVDQKTATTLQVEGATFGGTVKSVDAAKSTITLITRRGRDGTPEEEKTFTVAKDARVLIDGTESKLADIKVADDGPTAGLRFALDQKTVNSISIGTGGERRR
jgi:hypothetical protein